MDNLLLSFHIVAPLMLYMAAGYVIRAAGLLDEAGFQGLSRVVFCACVPALCCDNLRALDFAEAFSDPSVLYMAAAVLLLFLITALIVPRFCSVPARCGVLIHGIFRSNDGVFGLAVAAALFGPSDMGLMVLCVAVTIPLYNLLAVVVMEYYRGGRADIGRILLKVLTNPIILGCIAGALLSLLKLRLPAFIETPLAGLGSASAPLGFLALGGALSFRSLRENRLALSMACLFKLAVIPAVVLFVFYLLGMRGSALLVAAVIFGAPTAMTVYPMACSMGGDEKLAGGIVALTSALSLLSMFLIIFLLRETGVA
ncbi:MAG: AEC family transporter [Clostridia bacterium]|nr:AEC family transporter [Clostridia bacterium]